MGAEIVFMPHVTGCLPSNMPGRGVVDRKVWDNRERDPVPLRLEFDGRKGRWRLTRGLPARAWESGIYALCTNRGGFDPADSRPRNATIVDSYRTARLASR